MLGHDLTVFEKLSEPGGMVRYGIPDYRLPKDILEEEIGAIRNIGVEIKTDCIIESPAKLLKEGYDAVFLAIGAHKGLKLGIDGEDLPAVMDCIPLMRDLNSGKKITLGAKVAIIGGGNAAIDTARCALRLGSKEVTVLYRRSREEMPASPPEIDDALTEGVKIEFLSMPAGIRENNGKIRMDCLRTRLGDMDIGGRRQSEPVMGSEFIMDVDSIISAIGQEPEIPGDFGPAIGQGNKIQVDTETLSTDKKGIFAGGDAVSGPASVIEAIADGRRAAIEIDRYLGGKGELDMDPVKPEEKTLQTELQGFPVEDRARMPTLSIDARLKDFSPVELGFSEDQAINEAKRCLRCDLPLTIVTENCTGCLTCVMRCSLRFDQSFSPLKAKVKVTPFADGRPNEISFRDECDTCGICARSCPHDAIYRGERRIETDRVK
ncbi:MAG: FAD-dependent oxidoreductase, partial [Thermodesulfobacteriota bacterium]|nr:FAD-dependent oxidoreductase [Thermodesulfobacteriota bacterium]